MGPESKEKLTLALVLEGLMTHQDHRRRGYASELLKWANHLADEVNLESYLDGGRSSVPLYRSHGYEEVDLSAVGGVNPTAAVPMLRPRKSAEPAYVG